MPPFELLGPPVATRAEARILVVESNAHVGGELVEHLCADRYQAVLARTPGHARTLARAEPLRAIVLGALDPPRGALDLLEEIRSSGRDSHHASAWDERLPAIVISSRAEQLDMLRAFEMGADDFIGGKRLLFGVACPSGGGAAPRRGAPGHAIVASRPA